MELTLSMIMITCAGIALGLTLLTGFLYKKVHKSWLMSFAQYFTGVLFVFSGFVKAVDPLGTAYKMEQYFNEFYYTFQDTWFSFLAPVFPFFNNYTIIFSVFMIVFEIILGMMLIMGMKGKLTGWLFLLLVGFFTFLTGFTYLTGYVPEGVNFFSFGSWGEYKATNMKVTDCGCFGDFIKLEPKTSFLKDVFLLIPAIFFVFRYKDMHQWFTKNIRFGIIGLSTIGLLIYCFSNYVWDIPHADFRPFRIGTDVASIKEQEQDAQANVQIIAWKLKKEDSDKIVELPNDQYMKSLSTYNKANGWSVVEQVKSEPLMKTTKISDFDIKDFEDNEVTYEYLEDEGYHFMIVSHKMYSGGDPQTITITKQDTTYVTDTILTVDNTEPQIIKSISEISTSEIEKVDYIWDESWLNDFTTIIKPLAEQSMKDGHKFSVVFGGGTQQMVEDFASETNIKADYYQADDILLKTIVRSNPGIVLWKEGKIIYKWHKNKLPSYESIKSEFIK